MRQPYRQDPHAEVVLLNHKNYVKNVDFAKPYFSEISQMHNIATTSNGSKHISITAKPQSWDHSQACLQMPNQYSVYDAEAYQRYDTDTVGDEHAYVNHLPANVNGGDIPAVTPHYNVLEYHESSLQFSKQAFNADGNNWSNPQLMSNDAGQKQLSALELSGHVSFMEPISYNHDYNNHIQALLLENIKSTELQWKPNYSAIYSTSMEDKDKNSQISSNCDVSINNAYISDARENMEYSGRTVSLSNKRKTCHVGKKRKRINTPIQRTAANLRERRRMCHLNVAFDRLKEHLPDTEDKRKLSRIETLKAAIYYISFLRESMGL